MNTPPTQAAAEIDKKIHSLEIKIALYSKIQGILASKVDDEENHGHEKGEGAGDDIAAMKPEVSGNQSVEQAQEGVAAPIANEESGDMAAEQHIATKPFLVVKQKEKYQQDLEDLAEQAAMKRLVAVTKRLIDGNQLIECDWTEKDDGFGCLDDIDVAEIFEKKQAKKEQAKKEQAKKDVAAPIASKVDDEENHGHEKGEGAGDDIAAMKPEVSGNQSVEQAQEGVAAPIANEELGDMAAEQHIATKPAREDVAAQASQVLYDEIYDEKEYDNFSLENFVNNTEEIGKLLKKKELAKELLEELYSQKLQLSQQSQT